MFQQVVFFYEGLMSMFLVFVAHFTTWQVFADKMVSSIQMMFNFINLSATNRNTRKLLVRQLQQPTSFHRKLLTAIIYIFNFVKNIIMDVQLIYWQITL